MRVATLLVFVMVVLSAATVSAQTPFIAVYFDNTFQTESTINPGGCPGIGTLDTLYIAMTNSNVFVSGVDFAVNYPPELNWISDMWVQPVTVGNTDAGPDEPQYPFLGLHGLPELHSVPSSGADVAHLCDGRDGRIDMG